MKLEQIVPNPNVRKPVYAVFAALGLALGAFQVGFASAEAGQPTWLTVAMAVYAFLAGAGFAVSQANTVTPSGTPTIEGLDVFTSEEEPEESYQAKHAEDNITELTPAGIRRLAEAEDRAMLET